VIWRNRFNLGLYDGGLRRAFNFKFADLEVVGCLLLLLLLLSPSKPLLQILLGRSVG
jgi:hypothetical protein